MPSSPRGQGNQVNRHTGNQWPINHSPIPIDATLAFRFLCSLYGALYVLILGISGIYIQMYMIMNRLKYEVRKLGGNSCILLEFTDT